MRKIDDKTNVPLGLALGGFFLMSSIVASGAWWASNVNDRLSRIEDALGIRGQGSRAAHIAPEKAKETAIELTNPDPGSS